MHEVSYIAVNKKSEIMKAAQEFAFYHVDRGENPSGDYHGNMHILETLIMGSRDEAEHKLESLSRGRFYWDCAIQFKDIDSIKLTDKQEATFAASRQKLFDGRSEYMKLHSVKTLKAEYIGCKSCGSKLAKKYIHGECCPLCRVDLRPQSTLDVIKKYNQRIKELEAKHTAMKAEKADKAPIRWLVKVEVHC